MNTCSACGLCMMIISPIIAAIVIGICCLCFHVSVSPSLDESVPTDCFGGVGCFSSHPWYKGEALLALTERLQNVMSQTRHEVIPLSYNNLEPGNSLCSTVIWGPSLAGQICHPQCMVSNVVPVFARSTQWDGKEAQRSASPVSGYVSLQVIFHWHELGHLAVLDCKGDWILKFLARPHVFQPRSRQKVSTQSKLRSGTVYCRHSS